LSPTENLRELLLQRGVEHRGETLALGLLKGLPRFGLDFGVGALVELVDELGVFGRRLAVSCGAHGGPTLAQNNGLLKRQNPLLLD
jgi:hypothetical protein